MLTRLKVRNFKKFDDVDIELGNAVVFIGPNNSGKTAALQALALWDVGLRRWNEVRGGKRAPEKRPGVTINRFDLIAVPVPQAKLLWRDLHTHVADVQKADGKQKTSPVFIEIVVEGVTEDKHWECGLEFYYANPESFYCRPLRRDRENGGDAMAIPPEASGVQVAFLPPMSGLAATETKLEPGRINVLIGEAQTAQVLRNLCFQIFDNRPDNPEWERLTTHIKELFGVKLLAPDYVQERGEITMAYEEGGVELDLSSSGRGFQHTLLLLAHLYSNPRTVLLLDEPDAHLEILRQGQIYEVLTRVAREQNSQVIAASHSEVLLRKAADRDVVVAFVGSPHRIDDRGSQVLKSLKEIGYEDYYQAEMTGWVLYLEGSTDLAILRAFAETLGHEASSYLERPFVHDVGNQPQKARTHFWGLREASPDLLGIALFDRLEQQEDHAEGPLVLQWRKREIENYLCQEDVLMAYARGEEATDLFSLAKRGEREDAMRASIREVAEAREILGDPGPWSDDIKASDEFLTPVFRRYFEKLDLPNLLAKSNYHELAGLVPEEQIDPEVVEKLDAIVALAKQAKPISE